MQRKELKNYFRNTQAMYNLTAYNSNAFALTFAFAPLHKGNTSKAKRECKPTHRTVQAFVQTLTDTARNVNHFGQSVCKLDTINLRTDRRATDNMGLASCGVTCLNSSVVFQINFSAGLTVLCPEIPHERQAQNRWR